MNGGKGDGGNGEMGEKLSETLRLLCVTLVKKIKLIY
jgi:hypothetical protein